MLVFAKEEGFHPLAVEPYLARCHLFRRSRGALRWLRRPRRVTDDWDRRAAAAGGSDAKGSGRARALSSFDGLHYLRLLDPAAKRELAGRPDRKAREPSWWALAILLALVGWGCWWLWKALPAGAGGRLIVAALAGLAAAAAVVIWSRAALTERASASLTRVLGAMLPVALVSLGLWWFGLGPVAVFIGVALAGLMLVVLRDHLVVAYMELLSPLRGAAGDLAEALERELRRDPETGRYTYYGRVWRGSESPLVALQYCFFYAFNDWRRKGGLNLHEADWEWATVFLRRQGDELRPEAVWLSQHHRGELRAWPQAPPAGGVTPQSAAAPPPTAPRVELAGGHPVLYVARGSHALYFDAGKRRLPELIPRPLLRRFVEWVVRASESARREAAEGQRRAAGLLPGGGRKGRPIDESMTEDDRDAGGRVVGPALPEGLSASRLAGGWRRVAIGEETPWIDFPGLWGVRTLLRNESGPPGPQWEREEKVGWAERGRPRRRAAWDDPTRALAASPPLPAER